MSEPRFNPNISQLKRQAKELKRAVAAGDSAASGRIAGHRPAQDGFTLRDAQHVIARESGYSSWHELIEAVGEQMVDERDLHRWFGVQLNNHIWTMLDRGEPGASSSLRDRELMLYGAYGSVYHWMEVGTSVNQARGEHLLARTALRVGFPELALHHARRAVELLADHPDLAEDWDYAFAQEALARTLAANGLLAEARSAFEEAARLGEGIGEEGERAVFLAEFEKGEWFGLR